MLNNLIKRPKQSAAKEPTKKRPKNDQVLDNLIKIIQQYQSNQSLKQSEVERPNKTKIKRLISTAVLERAI